MSNGSTIRTVAHTAGVVLLLALVVPFVVFAVPGVAGADASYIVLSNSMNPSIEAGDVVIVEETPPEAIEEEDVITFRAGDPDEYHGGDADTDLVTHRVVDVDQSGEGVAFTTQGDANDQPDAEPVDSDQVVGVVAFTIPLIGWVIDFVGTQFGLLVMVVVPCVLLVANEAYELLYAGSDDTG